MSQRSMCDGPPESQIKMVDFACSGCPAAIRSSLPRIWSKAAPARPRLEAARNARREAEILVMRCGEFIDLVFGYRTNKSTTRIRLAI
jgi:hypothetical protein